MTTSDADTPLLMPPLQRYGQHDMDCAHMRGYGVGNDGEPIPPFREPCSCGFTATLDATRAARPDEGLRGAVGTLPSLPSNGPVEWIDRAAVLRLIDTYAALVRNQSPNDTDHE